MSAYATAAKPLTIGDRIGWAIRDSWSITRRDLIRTARQPEMMTFSVVMGVFFLLLFNYVFGGAIGAGADVDYVQYLVPGVFVITTLTGAQQTGTGLAVDLTEGVINRFRSLPMSQLAVIAGRTIADGLRNIVAVLLVAAVGYLLGFRFASLGGAVGAVAIAVGMGFAFSWLNGAIAAKVRNAEMVGMLSMFWLFPLMLASTAFAPTDSMPTWLQGFVKYQPISVASDAARALSNGTPVGDYVWQAMLWIAILLAILVPLAIRFYRRP